MKTFKQKLIDEPKTLSNGVDTLNLFFSEKLNKFCLELNGYLFTYKTWNNFVNKRNEILEANDFI